jgi:hypothetical protein
MGNDATTVGVDKKSMHSVWLDSIYLPSQHLVGWFFRKNDQAGMSQRGRKRNVERCGYLGDGIVCG